jgi:excisionase family DNA binding protein
MIMDLLTPTDEEQDFAARAVRQLRPDREIRLQLQAFQQRLRRNLQAHQAVQAQLGGTEEEFVLVPAKIAKLFQQILLEVASGHAVSIVPHERMLSTQDAADFLHVSRPYLIKFLGEERVEIQKVGNRRRIAFGEVLKLKEKLRRRSDKAFSKLAELDRELGID